jgi:hypothetical protein
MTKMSVLSWLKPENGPIGSALDTWLEFAPSGIATRFLLLWFVILWTAFQALLHASTGLDTETLAIYAAGLHPTAGYDFHPPLAALVSAGWFSAFPATDWAFHLLGIGNAALGLYGVDLIARHYLGGDKRIIALMMLLLTPFYQFYADRFSWEMTLLSTWPLATYCFLRAFETRGLAWSIRAGAAAGLAMLGDYYSLVLLAGFLAAVVAAPGRAAYLRSAAPYISAAAGLIVLSPHLHWLYVTHFESLSHVAAQATATPLADALGRDAIYVASLVGYAAVPVLIWWLAVRPDSAIVREVLWPSDPDGRMLVILLVVPLVLPAVVAPFIGAALTPLSTTPAWFLLPVVLLRPKAANLSRIAAIRITALVAILTLCALLAAPLIAWQRHLGGPTREGREYYRQIANEVTTAWHLGTGQPLRIVMGDRNLVAAATFYSPDHPDSVPNFDLASTPWVTPDRLKSEGHAAICSADDQPCVDEARRLVADRTDTQFITFSTINRYLGKPGRLGRFLFILAAPQARPRIMVR